MVSAASPLLSVEDLSVHFQSGKRELQVTCGVTFDLKPGERVGLVGESGCGKTVTGLALLRLLPSGYARATGRVRLGGQELLSLPERAMRDIRGRRISMIFQEPMSALDPVFTIGRQLTETIRAHFPVSEREARERAVETLVAVGIPLPRQRLDEYPHQLSGGMRQRAMIAMAIVCEPDLIVADEPTTALDVTIQAQIIDLLLELGERTGTAMIFITHDLGVVAECCERLITMYAGQIVEDGPIDDVLVSPRHPYTAGLLASMPVRQKGQNRLKSIPGRVPSPEAMPDGCRFAERCDFAETLCRDSELPLRGIAAGRLVRCRRAETLSLAGVLA